MELHRLGDEIYPPAPRQRDGELVSDVIPGFTIPVRAVFDEAKNLAALKKILG